MRTLCVWIFLVAYVHASRLHYTALMQQPQQQQAQPPPTASTNYHSQDSRRGLYSFAYSDDRSAKAEHNSADGSTKGFYAYVDADGELQTVEYVAGRREGFQVAATNLPKAPVDTRRGPAPVKDTPEVQMAKREHFEAYREAERRAALAAGSENDESPTADDREQESNESRQQQGEQRVHMSQSKLREQQQLLMKAANRNENRPPNPADGTDVREEDLNDGNTEGGKMRQITSYRVLSASDLPHLYTSASSRNGLGSSNAAPLTLALPAASLYTTALSSQHPVVSDPLPLHAYYASFTPSTTITSYHLPSSIISTQPSWQTGGTITTTTTSTRDRSLSQLLNNRLDTQ